MKAGISVTGSIKGDKTTIYRWLLGMAWRLFYTISWWAALRCRTVWPLSLPGAFSANLAGASRSEAANISGIHRFMAGWGAGFALALVLSVLPGLFNGYILGGVLLVAAVIAKLISRQREEVPAP